MTRKWKYRSILSIEWTRRLLVLLIYKGALEDKFNKVKRALALGKLNARYEWMVMRNSYISAHYGDNRMDSREKQTVMKMKLGSITAD